MSNPLPNRPAAGPQGVRRRVLGLYPAVGVSFLGYAMMATLFVPMVLTPSAGYLPAGTGYATRTSVLGLLLVLYPLGQFVGNPVLGALSDRHGRRALVLASTLATIGCYVGIAAALSTKNLLALAPILLVCGFAEANLALASSAIADLTDATTRPRYLGYLFAVTSVAYTVGPPAGGLLAAQYGYAAPFWAVLALLVAILAWLWLRFAETLPQASRRPPARPPLAGLVEVVTDRSLRRLYAVNLLLAVAAMGFWRVVTIYLVAEWGLRVGEVSAIYALFALAAGIANLLAMPRLSARVPVRVLCLAGLLVGAACVAATGLPAAAGVPHALVWAVLAAAVASFALALAMSAGTAVISAAAPAERQGGVLGNNAALIVAGEVLGAAGGSLLAGLDAATPLLVLAVVALGSAAVLAGRRRRNPAQATRPAVDALLNGASR